MLTETNPKNETTTLPYDTNGYLVTVDGPLPGTNDTDVAATYDAFGRVRTKTDESGYTLTFDYDALDRITRITHPDGTFEQYHLRPARPRRDSGPSRAANHAGTRCPAAVGQTHGSRWAA